jgi:hypothetical protein
MKVMEKKIVLKNLRKPMKTYNNSIKYCLLIFILLGDFYVYSQECDSSFYKVELESKLECVQGIHSPINDNNPNSETYLITKGFKTLGLILKKVGKKKEFYELNIGYEGFYDFKEYAGNKGSYSVVDSFYVCDLKQNGPHYITFLEKDLKDNGWTTSLTTQPEYFCDGGFIESSDRHLIMFEPVLYLPYTAYNHLQDQGKIKGRDYISEFDILTKLKKARVIMEKAHFHNTPNESSKRKAFVIKGDEVIIDDIKKDWVKVAYEGKNATTEGWLKRADLQIID